MQARLRALAEHERRYEHSDAQSNQQAPTSAAPPRAAASLADTSREAGILFDAALLPRPAQPSSLGAGDLRGGLGGGGGAAPPHAARLPEDEAWWEFGEEDAPLPTVGLGLAASRAR